MTEIFTRAGQAAWGHILPAGALAALRPPERWHPSRANVLVGEYDSRASGFACVRASADADASPTTGELDAFYVMPSLWGRGVGRALLAEALAHLAASGFREATLWTEHRNDRPLRIYRAGGWTPDGAERRRVHGATDIRELRVRRVLTQD